MPFIAYGWHTRKQHTSLHAQHFCPDCSFYTTFIPVRRQQYFHLFFIPLFKTDDEPIGLACSSCSKIFDEDSLINAKPPTLRSWKCPQCGKSWPETNIRCAICKVRPDGSAA